VALPKDKVVVVGEGKRIVFIRGCPDGSCRRDGKRVFFVSDVFAC